MPGYGEGNIRGPHAAHGRLSRESLERFCAVRSLMWPEQRSCASSTGSERLQTTCRVRCCSTVVRGWSGKWKRDQQRRQREQI